MVPPALRFSVLERDGFACQFCGTKAPEADLEASPLIPESIGGSISQDNLVAMCAECHAGRSSRLVLEAETNEQIKERLALLIERRDLLQECTVTQKDILAYINRETWLVVTRWERGRGRVDKNDECKRAPSEVIHSLRSALVTYGFAEVVSSTDIALARHWDTEDEKSVIRYFFGILRKRRTLDQDCGAETKGTSA